MTLSFLEPAQAELEEAIDYYNERGDGLGNELAAEVEKAIRRILQNPLISPEVRRNPDRRRHASATRP